MSELQAGAVTNAVWVKKGYGGNYVWTICVTADGNSIEDLDIATERAVAVARSLEDILPTEKKVRGT